MRSMLRDARNVGATGPEVLAASGSEAVQHAVGRLAWDDGTAPVTHAVGLRCSNVTSAAELVDRLTLLVPDFPKPGVLFRDLTPTLADPEALRAITDDLVAAFAGRFDLVAGIEARGFLLAAAAAYASGTGVIAVRKAGKLPPETLTEHYELEYGAAALEIRADQLAPGTRVLVLDDVLATGGTLEATCGLLERAGAQVAGIGVVLELAGLGGRDRLGGRPIHAIREV